MCRGALYLEALTTEDIKAAADMLRPIYDRTGGRDGFVSYEVSPRLAHDTAGTLDAAHRYFAMINRPNLLVKVPATHVHPRCRSAAPVGTTRREELHHRGLALRPFRKTEDACQRRNRVASFLADPSQNVHFVKVLPPGAEGRIQRDECVELQSFDQPRDELLGSLLRHMNHRQSPLIELGADFSVDDRQQRLHDAVLLPDHRKVTQYRNLVPLALP